MCRNRRGRLQSQERAVVKGCDRSPISTTLGQVSTGRNDRRRKNMASNEELKRSKAHDRPSRRESKSGRVKVKQGWIGCWAGNKQGLGALVEEGLAKFSRRR